MSCTRPNNIDQERNYEEIIEIINVGGFNHLELLSFSLFTNGDTSDLLMSAICRGNFTKLTLNVCGMTFTQQMLLAQFIYNSSIDYVCFGHISDTQHTLIKGIILSPNLRVLKLNLCDGIPAIFDTITTQLSKSPLVELEITGFNIHNLNDTNKLIEIKNAKLRILSIKWMFDMQYLTLAEQIFKNNIRLVYFNGMESPAEYNRKIAHNASVSVGRACNCIVRLYKPGHSASITSHKHILSIIANKVRGTVDDDKWIDLAVKKYSQTLKAPVIKSGYKVLGLIAVGIVALSIFYGRK